MSLFVVAVGIYAFTQLGRLEMPDFLIKIAVVMTPYPGASPAEVEREVMQVVEESIQQLDEIRELHSISQEGLSVVYVEMEEHVQNPVHDFLQIDFSVFSLADLGRDERFDQFHWASVKSDGYGFRVPSVMLSS